VQLTWLPVEASQIARRIETWNSGSFALQKLNRNKSKFTRWNAAKIKLSFIVHSSGLQNPGVMRILYLKHDFGKRSSRSVQHNSTYYCAFGYVQVGAHLFFLTLIRASLLSGDR